jgi:uncharacterized protein (DUF2235 family)
MPKNIVFCADGTWNGPGAMDGDDMSGKITNVFKLFVNLDGHDDPCSALLANEQERNLSVDGTVRQCAKYLHGVGDSSNYLAKILGGTVGAGLIARIVRGYTYISRNYEPGDRIYIVGFSRGAYTARALAGLIAKKGLLDARQYDLDDKKSAYQRGAAVWYSYRKAALAANGDRFDRLQETLFDLPHFIFMRPDEEKLLDADIEAVAVWDTVGSLGIPQFTLQDGRVDGFQFADQDLSAKVHHGLHAIAIDEQRDDFMPTLWNADPRITQMLFPGSHSDVGGGYPIPQEGGLSDCALVWMAAELEKLGVLFSPSPKYNARPLAIGAFRRPWLEAPWTLLPHSPRTFRPGLCLAQCVIDRCSAALDPAYAPGNLADYLVKRAAEPQVAAIAA